jgi:hypothetical protein
MATHYNDDRVSIEPFPVKSGDTAHINYQGLLRNSGADEVYLHYGIDGWKDVNTVKMSKMHDGIFGAEIKASGSHEINFCFKDSANNWDTNSGWNWKADVH